MRDEGLQIGDCECECEILGVRLTVFPNFRELYYGLRTQVVLDLMKRRRLELRIGEEVSVLGLITAEGLSGEGNLQQSLFAVVYLWFAVDIFVTNEGVDKRKVQAA